MSHPAQQPASPTPEEAQASVAGGDVFVFPASFGQHAMWFVDQLGAGGAYNLPILLRVTGRLDPALLERALNEIVRRHETLRTTFSRQPGGLVQVIAPAAALSLRLVDLSERGAADREALALEQANAEGQRAFELNRGPLFRASLWRLDAQAHLLLLTMHHLVADGWSLRVLLRELAALYQAFGQTLDSPLPALPLQYPDFAQWERARVLGSELEGQLSFWKTAMAGAPPFLDFPTDRPRPARQTFSGNCERSLLSPGLSARIKTLARREGVTPFMALFAAFLTLLYRHTGQTDLVVGSPVANRTRVELESLIGLFMNTLALRADLSGNPTFRELLSRVRRVCVEGYAHQDLPFARLVEEIRPPRDTSRNPVFQVMFLYQRDLVEPFRAADLQFTPIDTDGEGGPTDFSLSIIEHGEELAAEIEYNTDLLDAPTIQRMLSHLRTLLEAAVEDPELRLDAIPLMTPDERHTVLVQWNETVVPNPSKGGVLELFEEHAARTPSAVALELDRKALTYGQLNERANQLARFLSRRGVGPETVVGLNLGRSMEMVVAMLGILKAGGAYLPLDPEYPPERLRFMVEDAGVSLVVTKGEPAESVPDGLRTVRLDSEEHEIAKESGENVPSPATAKSLAYVMYTSGSTGKPKGVEIEHGSLANYVRFASERFGIRAGERVLQFASLSFDTAVEEIFSALSGGATLVLRSEEMIATVANFLATCRDWNITVLDLPTSYWHELVAVASAERLSLPESLRLVVIGGEKAIPERFRQWQELAGNRVRLVNTYGPTEATVVSTIWEPDGALEDSPPRLVPIGRPIPNVRAYVLDGRLQPVPVGVVGELHVGGVSVARGYRNRPELTAAKFIADPFRDGKERLYRTGDRVRFLFDGNLEYVGRVDGQVKLRGFRIEPGEVEAAMLGLAGVREAAVQMREDVPGQPRLVGYVAADPASPPSVADLRRGLMETLPPYMVPSSFVLLESLPRTPAGKLDALALPPPESGRPDSSASVGPRNALESKLVHVWERVLNVRPVGVTDNFFDLGGHSLLAVRLLAQVEKATGKQLSLSTIFWAQTVEEMAARLEDQSALSSLSSSLLPIQPRGSRPPLFCVHAWGADGSEYRGLARCLGPDQPLYGLAPQGLDGKRAPHDRLEDMAAHYIREIRGIQPQGPYYLGGWSLGGNIAFEMARQLRAEGQEVALLALLDSCNAKLTVPTEEPLAQVGILGFIGRRLRYHSSALMQLELRARLPYFGKKSETAVRWVGETLQAAYDAILTPRAVRRVHAANRRAAQQFVPRPYHGTVTLFRAADWGAEGLEDPTLGWKDLSGGRIEVIEIQGGHLTILEEPNLRHLAEKLQDRLRNAFEKRRRSGRRIALDGSAAAGA